MRFLCDVHIPMRLSKHIVKLGFECQHVNNVLEGYHTKDRDIADYCDASRLILITKDRDFKNSYLLKQTPSKLIKINLGNVSSNRLIDMMDENIQQINSVHEKFREFMIEMETDGTITVTI
ncbi:MAG: hypothetical protein GC178_13925 [Flavobacteriales bacterium]|nr:hypothetical protein [Flavobacteriales bacterium]